MMEPRVSRRSLLELAGAASLAGVPASMLAGRASAGRNWCRLDPEFLIDGETLHVYLSGDQQLHHFATGPAAVTLRVPVGTDARFVWADDGFGGRGYDVQIEETSRLAVDDEGNRAIEVLAELVHDHHSNATKTRIKIDRHPGKTNERIRVKGKLTA